MKNIEKNCLQGLKRQSKLFTYVIGQKKNKILKILLPKPKFKKRNQLKH